MNVERPPAQSLIGMDAALGSGPKRTIFEFDERLHAKMQELKAANTPEDKRRIVLESVDLYHEIYGRAV